MILIDSTDPCGIVYATFKYTIGFIAHKLRTGHILISSTLMKGSTCSECIHDYARSHARAQITNIMIRCLSLLACHSMSCIRCHVLLLSVSRASVHDDHVLAIRHNFPKSYSTSYDVQYTQLMSTCVIVIHIIA